MWQAFRRCDAAPRARYIEGMERLGRQELDCIATALLEPLLDQELVWSMTAEELCTAHALIDDVRAAEALIVADEPSGVDLDAATRVALADALAEYASYIDQLYQPELARLAKAIRHAPWVRYDFSIAARFAA